MRSVLFLFLASLTAVASAATDGEIKNQIEGVLAQHHPQYRPSFWQGLGPSAPHVMIGMYQESESILEKTQLLVGLGGFSTPEVEEFLKAQASSSPDDVIRNGSLRSLGVSQGARDEDFVAGFLKNPDSQTRLAAAEVLQKIGDSRSRGYLDEWKASEKAPGLVSRVNGILPTPVEPLLTVSTSEDAPSRELEGNWRGYLVRPKAGAASGMSSEGILLRISGVTPEIQGDITLKTKAGMKNFVLDKMIGKKSHFQGKIESKQRDTSELKAEIKFDIAQEESAWILRGGLSPWNGTLILKRDPKK